MIDRSERHFTIRTASEKYELYAFLSTWLRRLTPPDLSAAINDLCKRYSVDLAALSREAAMDWSDLARLAADPNVTIGSATVNYPALANLKDAAALREMTMGRAVAETALRREIRHFAYPFGDRDSFRRAHVVMAEQAGFASAVSTIPGIVECGGPHQSACVAAHRLGRKAAVAAHHARAAVGRHLRAGTGRQPDRSSALGLTIRPRHPAHDRHRRQHPAQPGHDVEDRLQPA